VAQAFDKVWHEGLSHKLNKLLPKPYAEILTAYISDRTFRVKHEEEYSDLQEIKAGVPQGSVLAPILYLLYTSDLPTMNETTSATFADDTALIATGKDAKTSTNKVQAASKRLLQWSNKWNIKFNEQKCTQVNFTNKRLQDPPKIVLNGATIPIENNAKYLGVNLDVRLKWKHHIKKKREELNLKYKKYSWLLGRSSNLSTHNKISIYNQILKPVWLYGSQIWGCATVSNIKIIQTFQNKVLRNIVKAPWYIRNDDIHRDLGIPTVEEEIKKTAVRHKQRLAHHINPEILQLLDHQPEVRRLKRKRPFDLISCSV